VSRTDTIRTLYGKCTNNVGTYYNDEVGTCASNCVS